MSGQCAYELCRFVGEPAPYSPETWVHVHRVCSEEWAERTAAARERALTLHPRDTSGTVVDDDDPEKLRQRGVYTNPTPKEPS